MEEERDVEIFERIPWESLEQKPDRRWLAYLLAGVVVLGAIGISLGRQMSPPPTTLPVTSLPPASVMAPPATVTTVTAVAAAPQPDPTWSEADLMALPATSLETSAAALAEWFVIEYFTRDEPGGSRSYVDWAGTFEVQWTDASRAEVTVLVRRLAALGDDPYQRLEAEAWKVRTDLGETGWEVVGGPIRTELPEMTVSEAADGVEWVDDAGVSWTVAEEGDPPG